MEPRRDAHWDAVYSARSDAELSWAQEEPALSLRLVRELAPDREARVLDVGAGASPLAGRLLDEGYASVTVLDVSEAALERLRAGLAQRAARVRFLVGDLLEVGPLGPFDVWHDRAVFHFLTRADERSRYAALAHSSVGSGGHLIIAAFAPDGPAQCSGLPVCRYDANGLADALGPGFTLVRAEREVHHTPWGAAQPFTYAVLRRD